MDNNDIVASLDPSGKLGEFIKTRKWPIVAEYCEKQGKKSEASVLWKIVRAIALLTDQKPSKKDIGLHELQDLLENGTPVTDPAALLVLEGFNQSILQDEPISNLLSRIWERAAQKLSGNTSWLFKIWFQAKFLKGYYSDAKQQEGLSSRVGFLASIMQKVNEVWKMQATMAWMKAYPKDHDPFYLFIIINELISRLPETSPAESKLCGMLASKALATAASTTDASSRPKNDIAGRTLASHDDLTVLIEIYQRQAKYGEALQVLQSPKTGLTSHIGKSSWPSMLQMVELQGLCGDFESQWILSYDTLRAAHPGAIGTAPSGKDSTFGSLGDDWRIWSSLVIAALNLSSTKPEFVARTEHLFTEFENTNSRNARLAQLKFYARMKDYSNSEILFKKIQVYFERYSRKVACMRDVMPRLASLLQIHQKALVEKPFATSHQRSMESMETKANIADHLVEQLNCLKLDYTLVASRTRREEKPKLFGRLVRACLQLYQVSVKLDLKLPHSDQGPVDDAAILAATALVHLYHLGDRAAILKSIVVLEHLLRYSKHNYEAMLILIKLYIYLGVGSLAIDRYARLSVKNIQHASISWILFPRFSKIHPHPAKSSLGEPGSSVFDPIEEVQSALQWYESSGTMTIKAIERAIKQNQYLTILGLLETQVLLQAEVSRVILHHEESHLSRFLHEASRTVKATRKIPKRILDSRDRSAFPNYEAASQFAFVELIPSVIPRFSRFYAHSSWLLYELEVDQILDRLSGSSNPIQAQEVPTLQDHILPEDLRHGLTPIEAESLSMLKALERIVSLASTVPIASDIIAGELDRYEQRFVGMKDRFHEIRAATGSFIGHLKLSDDLSIPLWFAFHAPFTILSTAKAIKAIIQTIIKDKQLEVDRRRELQKKIVAIVERCDELKDAVNSQAKAQRDAIKPPSYLDSLRRQVCGTESDIAGRAIRDVIGVDAIDGICTTLSESWVDAFDGVIKSSSAP